MSTIATLRAALTSKLDELAATYGETTSLDTDDTNAVSYGVDDVNETWNPNLPPRPHS